MKGSALRLLFFLPLLAACGCFDYQEELTLRRDGTGSMTMHYIMDESATDDTEEDSSDQDKAEIERRFAGTPLKVEETRIYTEEGRRHIAIALSFDDLNNIGGQGHFAERQFKLARVKGRLIEYRTVIKADSVASDSPEGEREPSPPAQETTGGLSLTESFGADLTRRLYAGHSCRYILNAPGRVTRASQGGKIEGNRVTWEFPMAQAMAADLVMTAVYRAPLPFWIWPALGAAALAGLAAALLFLLRRRALKQASARGAASESA